uniref:sugar-binding domain-containing protein n=1 Tax=Candidatus Fimivicinus sp. TaxID=3056640 RepID=UPI003FEFA488
MRTTLPLNFGWRYTPAFDPAMVTPTFDASAFALVDIPHTCKELPLNYFDERDYQFVSGYRKEFALPRGMRMKGNRFLLHFEGVANAAKVYLNGTLLGEHKGGYTAFVFDVTDTVKTRGNVLTVEVDSTERPEIPPFGRVVDYLCYGGIYREVWLECVNEVYIEDTFIRT